MRSENLNPFCFGIVDLNVFSVTVNKSMLIELSRSNKRVLALITLFFSDGPRSLPPPRTQGDDRTHIPRAKNQFASRSQSIRIIYSLILLIPKPKCELPRCSVAAFCYLTFSVYAHREGRQ